MKHCMLACLFVLVSGVAYGQSIDSCPALPKNSALNWEYHQGPDFDICRAMRGKVQVFGVYLGNFPPLQPQDLTNGQKGNVGGFEVQWIDMKREGTSSAFAKQTVIQIHKSPGVERAHIWIQAASAEDLSQTQKILSQIKF